MNGHKFPREFELVTKSGDLKRLRLPGGWLIVHHNYYISGGSNAASSESMIFLHDKDLPESWNLEHQ